MTTNQFLIFAGVILLADLAGLLFLHIRHNRWRKRIEETFDQRVNEIISNRNQRMMHDTGRRSMPRLDAGEPARVSRARIVRDNPQA